MSWLLNKFYDFLIQREDRHLFWHTSNLTPDRTGLSFVVFVGSGDEALKYPARIRISKTFDWNAKKDVIIQIEEPKIIGKSHYLTNEDFNKIITMDQFE